MAVFKIGAPDVFDKLGNKKLKPEEALAFLRDFQITHVDWWFALLYTGDGLDVVENTGYDALLTHIGLKGSIPESSLSEYQRGWGCHASNRFPEIYAHIQQIDQWK